MGKKAMWGRKSNLSFGERAFSRFLLETHELHFACTCSQEYVNPI